MKCPVCKTELQDGTIVCPICKFDKLNKTFVDAEDAVDYVKTVVEPYRNQWQESLYTAKQQAASELYSSMMASQLKMIRNLTPSSIDQFEFSIFAGTATVTKYNGENRHAVVPNQYDGHPIAHIGPGVFEGCQNIESVVLPEGLLTIGENAFRNSSLSSINIPETCHTIGESAFCDSKIREIVFPNATTEIASGVCNFCKELRTIVILNGTRINGHAFSHGYQNARNRVNVILPDSLQVLELAAFDDTPLEQLVLPRGTETVTDGNIFTGVKINKLVVLGDNTKFETKESFSPRNIIAAVYCNNGSEAQVFARKNGIKVLPLSDFN